jgi:RNA-directed DNA polymerase
VNLLDKLSDQANLRLAWKALHKNPPSFGIDQITINDFRDSLDHELENLSIAIKNGSYKPQELKGHPLEKGKSSTKASDKVEYRILKIPTVRDRVVQKAIEQLTMAHLDKAYNIAKNGVSFAYMKNGGVEKAALQVRKYYRDGYSYVYSADIRKFFDEVDNKLLLGKIKAALPDHSLMPLIETFLKIDINNIEEIKERTQLEYQYNPMVGIAQGSPLSPMFANVFLADLDKAVIDSKLKMVRYADDIVILTKTKDEAINAHKFITKELRSLKLTAHPLLVEGELPKDGHEKHSTVHKYSGLLFLGLRFTGDKIYPSGTSYNNAIWTVRRAAYNRKLTFIKKLISIEARIQGWCSSYAFTDYLDDPTMKNDKLLEDILSKVLNKTGLSTKGKLTAMQALGIRGYKVRLSQLKTKRESAKKKEQATEKGS